MISNQALVVTSMLFAASSAFAAPPPVDLGPAPYLTAPSLLWQYTAIPGYNTTLENGTYQFNTTPNPFVLTPGAGEQGHQTAVRFEYAEEMWVKAVHFPIAVDRNNGCGGDNPPILHLYANPGLTPDPSPTPLASVVVETAATGMYGYYPLTVEFSPSVPIPASDNLFVAIEYVGDLGEATCLISTAVDSGQRTDTDYWSDSVTAPFPWVELDTYGFIGKTVMSVDVFVPE